MDQSPAAHSAEYGARVILMEIGLERRMSPMAITQCLQRFYWEHTSVALSILEKVQTVKTNRSEFIAIGRDSCFIVETVIQRVQVGQDGRILNDPAMLRRLDMLLADLQYIERRIKNVKRSWWSGVKKIFNHQLDQDTIQACRERLTHAITLFGFQYDAEIRNQQACMHNLLIALITLLQASPYPPSPQIPFSSFPSFPSSQSHGPVVPLSPTASPAGTGFNLRQNPQNHLSSHAGNVEVNDIRDGSFNVSGTGNNISFYLAR